MSSYYQGLASREGRALTPREEKAGAKARAWSAQRAVVKLERGVEKEEKKRKVVKTEHSSTSSTTSSATTVRTRPAKHQQPKLPPWEDRFDDDGLHGFQYDTCVMGCPCARCKKRRVFLHAEHAKLKKERFELREKLERNTVYTMLVTDRLDRYGLEEDSSDDEIEVIEDV